MKVRQLIGLGMLAAPVAAAGAAQAQTSPAPKPATASESTSYISVAIGQIGDADYSYTVEELFPVEAHVGEGYIIDDGRIYTAMIAIAERRMTKPQLAELLRTVFRASSAPET